MEQIYTIPVNEAFDDSRDNPECGCPICTLFKRQQENELEIILGASMMEPTIRVETNRRGFCSEHYGMMLRRKNRLGMALMLESHLDELRDELFPRGLAAIGGQARAERRMQELECSCYVCSRIEFALSRMIETAVLLWERDYDFRRKLAAQPHFCLPHYRRLVSYGAKRLGKRDRADFLAEMQRIELAAYDALREDIKEFCRGFDYRAAEAPPSEGSKTSVDRTVRFLSAREGRDVKPT